VNDFEVYCERVFTTEPWFENLTTQREIEGQSSQNMTSLLYSIFIVLPFVSARHILRLLPFEDRPDPPCGFSLQAAFYNGRNLFGRHNDRFNGEFPFTETGYRAQPIAGAEDTRGLRLASARFLVDNRW